MSLNEISQILKDEKVNTKYDTYMEWKKKNNKEIAWVWYASTVSRVLKNSMYIWEYYYWKSWC